MAPEQIIESGSRKKPRRNQLQTIQHSMDQGIQKGLGTHRKKQKKQLEASE
jgi:hypothetical protein